VGDETDFFTGRFRRREQEGSDFLDNVSQCGIMGEESFFDGEEAFFESGIGRKLLSETDKSVDQIDAHGNSSVAIEYGGRHEGSVYWGQSNT